MNGMRIPPFRRALHRDFPATIVTICFGGLASVFLDRTSSAEEMHGPFSIGRGTKQKAGVVSHPASGRNLAKGSATIVETASRRYRSGVAPTEC
jgi:hypothetical protein